MTAVAKRTVELFYDVISPYSWIAFEELCRYRNKWNIELKFRPFFLGGIMQGSSNKPPAQVPAKGVYMMQDIIRLRQFYKIPINLPSNFSEVVMVKGSLSAQRLLTAVQLKRPEFVEPLTRELWMRVWSRDEDIASIDSLKEASKVVGLSESDVNSLMESLKSDAVKDRLKQTTQEALDAGAFGAPTMLLQDTNNNKCMVFGSDRMHIIGMLLGEKYVGPLVELSAKL